MMPSPLQILIILLIVVLLFGTKKLRNIGSDLGQAIKGFKKGMSDDEPGKLEGGQKSESAESEPQKSRSE